MPPLSLLIQKKNLKTLVLTAMFLALPVVLLGALTPQNIRQDASMKVPQKQPNIIIILASEQAYDSLIHMPTVLNRMGGRGMQFQNAFRSYQTPELLLGVGNYAESLRQNGYRIERVQSVRNARDMVAETREPFFVTINLESLQKNSDNRENCGNSYSVEHPSFNEQDITDKSTQIRKLPRLGVAQVRELMNRGITDSCQLKARDQEIALLLDALGSRIMNTIVIYTAQRGYSYGDHRIVGSSCLYDSCQRVPLLISFPDAMEMKRVSHEVVSLDDLVPTLMQLSRTSDQDIPGGESLIPLFTDHSVRVHMSIPIRSETDGMGIRTKEFAFIEYGTNERELYDLVSDPYQQSNLISNPEYQSVIEDLTLELARVKGE